MTKVTSIIERKGYTKYEDTAPERFMVSLLTEMGISYKHPHKLYDVGKDGITLTIDFVLEGMLALEVDGKIHDTDIQRGKTRWRDGLLISHGYRVAHIDAQLCDDEYREYLKEKIKEIRESKQMVMHIVG